MDSSLVLVDNAFDQVSHEQSVDHRQSNGHQQRKWPVMFWFILKFLGLYYHDSVVCKRRCYRCNVNSSMARRSCNSERAQDGSFGDIDYLVLTYEQTYISEYDTDEQIPSRVSDEEEEQCETCQFMWWNGDRVPDIYSEEEIGVKRWNHKGSGLLSVTMLLIGISMLVYNGLVPLISLWGKSEQILHLALRMTLSLSLLVAPIASMCSKFRSHFRLGGATKFAWATSLNVRYLILRAQVLDISHKGLPGKPFLLLCICGPLLIAVDRVVVFFHIGNCDITPYIVVTSLVGIIFAEYQSLFIYICYFIRVSFQSQLNLLLTYIKESDDVRKCRGVLFATASDFGCFKQLCDVLTVVVFPVGVLAIAANATWDYLVFSNTCVNNHREVYNAGIHVSVYFWSQVLIVYTLYLLALGGFQVTYVWKNFFANLIHLKEDIQFSDTWNGVLRNLHHFVEESHILLASVIFSVFGVYAGFKFGDQIIVFADQPPCFNRTDDNFCSSG